MSNQKMKKLILGITALVTSLTFGEIAMAEQTIGPSNYDASELQVENFIGTINITVTSEDQVSVRIVGEEEFKAHYHKRSNVETVMAMIKTKFGASVKSKTPVAQVNEVLCKVLCHNICVLIQSFYELGIESTFAPVIEPEPISRGTGALRCKAHQRGKGFITSESGR